ncbi:MAG: acyl-CoA dehydrogenase [Alphaproteobacteria bacterium]|nr:acyl-CoA dehydrogenase [Alphaproteobacteria bacterium]
MNFDFSDDQKLLKDQAQRFLNDKSSLKVVRRILDTDETHASEVWKGIVELGWTGTTIPEAYGGIGLGHLELCMIAEELGRSLAPVPFSSSVYLATEALLLAGSEAQKQKYMPPLAAGEMIGTLALSESTQAATPRTMKVSFDGGKVKGVKMPVPDGDVANFAVVAVKTGSGTDEKSVSLAIVDLTGPGVTRAPLRTLDPTRNLSNVTFDNAPGELLGAQGGGWAIVQKVLDHAAVLVAFEQVGGADACLNMAKEYALNRYAFGRPIASFQAIKHKLADMYIKNELARSNSYYGAWALSTGAPDLAAAAAGCRVAATEAFNFAAKENIQTHGGMGFTWEFDCHLYYRRAKWLSLSLGSHLSWKDKLVSELEKRNAA